MTSSIEEQKILLVDDKEENLIAIEAQLERPGLVLHKARSGNEALGMSITNNYALILMDVQMPEMDGFEAATILRSSSRTRHVPIIFVSAINKEQRHIFKGYDAGAVDYIFKPVDVHILNSKVNIFLEIDRQRKVVEQKNAQLQREITERRMLEAQLVQAQKLESMGQLAAGIAHEINTPMQYVGDNTRFFQDAFTDILNLLKSYENLLEAVRAGSAVSDFIQQVEEAREMADLEYLLEEVPNALAQSMEGIEWVNKIVRSMRSFSHPVVEDKIAIDINQAIESTLTISRNEWKYVAEMITQFDSSLPLVPCFPGEFNQVILNIIVNAGQAIAEVIGDDSGSAKGTITVSTLRHGDDVEIRIGDTGPGIPDQVRSKVFDLFFTTKDVGKGTGQGLAMAHSVIVEKHGGSLTFESEEGRGTTFIIRLPIDNKAQARGEDET